MTIIKKESPKLYADLLFLSKLISKRNSSYYTEGIFVDTENDCLVSTDGRRLHRINSNPLPLKQGIYKLHTTSKEIIIGDEINWNFPNYLRVIPETQTNYIDEWSITSKKKDSGSITCSLFSLYTLNIKLDYSYLLDLSDHIYKVGYTTPGKPVTFESEDRLAVIMPISRD